jgi:TPR repeat protein
MELYGRASKGEPEAQLEMGKVCERGGLGAPVDVQRAFFWYYRAALQENLEGWQNALRLKSAAQIDPATMAEPTFVSDGLWVVLKYDLAQGVTKILFGFEADGTVRGRVLEVGMRELSGNMFLSLRYKGQWVYDQDQLLLTLQLHTYAEGLYGRGQDERLQIELLGVNDENALFGRDGNRVGYQLRRPTQEEGES